MKLAAHSSHQSRSPLARACSKDNSWRVLIFALLIAIIVGVNFGAASVSPAPHPSPSLKARIFASSLNLSDEGSFYGITAGREDNPHADTGPGQWGEVFRINRTGQISVLHKFTGQDGAYPQGRLLLASDSSLYGVTREGGAGSSGTIFRLNQEGSDFTTFYTFSGAEDGGQPLAGLIEGRDGNLYGTTSQGGKYLRGTVFQLSRHGSFRVLHMFNETDGIFPEAGLLEGGDGYLYGTTRSGGSDNRGTIFRLASDGREFQTIYDFKKADGAGLEAELIEGEGGRLFGVAAAGGKRDNGTVFSLLTDGSGFARLHAFTGYDEKTPQASDGRHPLMVMTGPDGYLYGTTLEGGERNRGVVYRMKLDGSDYSVVYNYQSVDQDPRRGLVVKPDASIYLLSHNRLANGLQMQNILAPTVQTATADLVTTASTTCNVNSESSLKTALLDSCETINLTATGLMRLTSGSIYINRPVKIIGPGKNLLAISGEQLNFLYSGIDITSPGRVFFINTTGTVTISGLTIMNGTARGGGGGCGGAGGGGGAGMGGGLFINKGTVALKDVHFANNRAIGGNGGDGFGCAQDDGARTGGGGGGGFGFNFYDTQSLSFGGFGIGSGGNPDQEDGAGGSGGYGGELLGDGGFYGSRGEDNINSCTSGHEGLNGGTGGGGGGGGRAGTTAAGFPDCARGGRGGRGGFGGGGGGGGAGMSETSEPGNGGSGGYGGGGGGGGAASHGTFLPDQFGRAGLFAGDGGKGGTDNRNAGGGGGGGAGLGGAIFIRTQYPPSFPFLSSLIVNNVTFSNNTVTGGIGGKGNFSYGASPSRDGKNGGTGGKNIFDDIGAEISIQHCAGSPIPTNEGGLLISSTPVNIDATITTSVISGCSNTTGHTASVPDAGAEASYSWTITNGTITNGNGTRTINFNQSGSLTTVALGVTVTKYTCSNSSTKSVSVGDNQSPAITCPANITVTGGTSIQGTSPVGGVVVNYPIPIATDNCPGTVTVVCTPPSGTVFDTQVNVGMQLGKVHTVTCTATDSIGNVAGCSFQIKVFPLLPSITVLSPPYTTSPDPGSCSATVNLRQLVDIKGTDINSFFRLNAGPIPASTIPDTSVFPIGTTTVYTVATNGKTLAAVVPFTVTVVDNRTPALGVCPNKVEVIENPPGSGTKQVTYTPPIVTNNCNTLVSCTPASGHNFSIGTTTVTCSAAAPGSTPPSCSFTVKVVAACTIICPANLVLQTTTNQCTAVANYTTTTTGNCDSVTCVPPSGSTFPKGATTVICTPASGSACSFTVTVNDTQPPTIICPANTTRATEPGQCAAIVNYNPTATDNCSGVTTVVCSPTSGSQFPKGTTTVNCSATDAANLTASCGFTVTVNDLTPPAISCPANITINATAGQCAALVNYPIPTPSDNCAGVGAVVCTPPALSAFPVGTTTVNCLVNDASSNTGACSFTVTIADNQTPIITWPAANGAFTAAENLPPANSAYTAASFGPFNGAPASVFGNAQLFNFSGNVAPPAAGSATSSFNSIFRAAYSTGGSPQSIQAPASLSINFTFTNQTGAVRVFSSELTQLDISGGNLPAGIRLRESALQHSTGQTTIEAISGGGFRITSTMTIFTEFSADNGQTWQPSTASSGLELLQATDTNLCSAVIGFNNATATDNCSGISAVTCTPATGSSFNLGTTTVTCTVNDAASNPASSTFTIKVLDTQLPSLTCPANIVTDESSPGSGSTTVSYTTPTPADNCPSPVISCNPVSGASYPVGTTTVICTTTDAAGNTSSCAFTVQVRQLCAITCPANITQANDPNQCGAVITYVNPTTLGGCGTISCLPASSAAFPKGTTTVTCTTTDVRGNNVSCTFTVTVNDIQAPIITCPANLTQATDANQCQAVVNFIVTASDNCAAVGIPTCAPSSGSAFTKGTSTVNCTVTDAAGLTVNGSFTVTVNDTQAPNITRPANITQATDANLCSAVVSYVLPIASDNCPGLGVTHCTPSSGSTFAKGTTTVSCSVNDASNNQASCSFTVTVNDTQAPTITCPANLTQGNDSGQCSAVVSYALPAISDNCTGIGAVTCTPPAGSAFPKGTTTVTCRVLDASSNPSTCTFTVTINDTQNPIITCPANIIRNNDSGMCSAIVTYTNPIANDNCQGVTVLCSPTSSATFAKGVTTVNCTATDTSNNTATCAFTVTINDTQNPAIACPASIITNTASGGCAAAVTYNVTATDNCSGVATPTCNPPSGATFQKGTTTVNCSVSDASNNFNTCSFTVTVNDNEAPTVACPANITTNAAQGTCAAIVTYATPVATDNCGSATVVCNPPTGATFVKGTTTVTCTATDAAGLTGSCTFTVTVNDTQKPSISCPANVVQNTDNNQCQAIINYASPAVMDNCQGVALPSCTPPGGSLFPKGVTTVNCSVSDAAGNSNTCSFTVTVNDRQSPSLSCPANITQAGDAKQCAAVVTYALPIATDNCPAVGAVACTPASGSSFLKGITTVTCSATDTSSNSASCDFTVMVTDTQAPTIVCPSNITRTTAANLCTAVVTFTASASDNCSGATVVCSPASGSAFARGTTTVTCAATDASGNQSTPCGFTITINDAQAPSITCPANINKVADANRCSAVVTYATPQASDNCPGVGAVTCTPPSTTAFPKGATTVTCTATDSSGNSGSCWFTVMVADTQAPSITCPANITAVAGNPDAACVVTNYTATAVDNCPGVAVVCSPASGSCFALGVTTVSCTATDASGNLSRCSFTVTAYNLCLQDDANPATVCLINSLTGDYRFCCNGTSYTGRGVVTTKGSVVSLTHNPAGRRFMARVDKSLNNGTASLQVPAGANLCAITDRDVRNNSCSCAPAP
jgi:large repetitive protein